MQIRPLAVLGIGNPAWAYGSQAGRVDKTRRILERLEPYGKCPPSSFSPFQGFPENAFHLSGFTVNGFHITCYGMKDKVFFFQFPLIAEDGKKFCAKLFLVLRRTIFRSAPNDLPFATGRNEAWPKDAWNIFQLVTPK